METGKNAIHAPRCEGKLTNVGEKLAGLIQRKEDKIHLKLNTIKSVKAWDAFPFSNKIIRVSYCAIAYMHTSLFLFPSCSHDSFRFCPYFFSFTTFYNLNLCLCTVNVKPHANWRSRLFPANNFQHCWILHVASVCTPCCMLLRVVGSCLACEHIRFSWLFAARDVSNGGTSATQRQKFHTVDANQCLHNKSGSHGVPNINLSTVYVSSGRFW